MVCTHCDATVPPGAKFCPGCGNPPSGKAKPKSNKVVLALIIVAVCIGGLMFCGIISAIAIPNLLNAIDRGKQKRTMADIRVIAVAVEEYKNENGAYPVADDLESLGALLTGEFISQMPPADGWGGPIYVESDGRSYRLVSAGKDGILEGCDGGKMPRFDDDICFADGAFTQWPEGAQR